MKHLLYILLVLLSFSSCMKQKTSISQMENVEVPDGRGIEKAEKFGFKLAIQSYTFHKFTVVEALEKTKELGVKYIEIYPEHRLGGKWGDKSFSFELTSEERQEVKEYATKQGIKIVACGVYMTDNLSDWDKLFSFAKEMEMAYITCEPKYEHLAHIEKLAQEHNIKVAIHNHPQPSDYWNSTLLLGNIKDRSKSIGSGADIGHWRRSGLDQIKCLEELSGRIVSMHIKDVEPIELDDDNLEDCIWGQGVLDIDAVLLELKDQKFDGYLAIEYETNWENSVDDIKDCLFYYDLVTDRLF